MSSDFFKKLQPLFEATETDLSKVVGKSDKRKAARYSPDENPLTKKEATAELAKVGKGAKNPANVKENATDFFRKFSDIVTEAESVDSKKWYVDTKNGDRKAGPFDTELDASNYLAKLQQKHPGEETEGFKLVNESYDDEDDEDVKKADTVKGRDGKTQKDVDSKKKWSFDKADKKAEDRGAKKVAKEKVSESSTPTVKYKTYKSWEAAFNQLYPDGRLYSPDLGVEYAYSKDGKTVGGWQVNYTAGSGGYITMPVGKKLGYQPPADSVSGKWLASQDAGTVSESSTTAKRKIRRSSLEVRGVDRVDHPDYSDAYFSYGEYTDGTELTPDQLDALTDKYPDIVNELARTSTIGGGSEGPSEIDESQINEYLTRAGGDFSEILMLNLFSDLGTEEGAIASDMPEFSDDPAWVAVSKKYMPIALSLEAEVAAQSGRTLTEEESAAIDNCWYDGSDAYDDVETAAEYLPSIYDEQIRVIRGILDGDLVDEDNLGEGQVNEISDELIQRTNAQRFANSRAGNAAYADAKSQQSSGTAIGLPAAAQAKQSARTVAAGENAKIQTDKFTKNRDRNASHQIGLRNKLDKPSPKTF